MYSTLSYQIANAHTADLHRQATRERAASAAARARSAQPHHRTVTAATQGVRALLGTSRPSPIR